MTSQNIKVDAGKIYLVSGRAVIRFFSGKFLLIGSEMGQGKIVEVPNGKKFLLNAKIPVRCLLNLTAAR